MKVYTTLSLLSALLISSAANVTPVHASADMIAKVIKSAAGAPKDILCRKGNIFTQTFSLRSFNGELCNKNKGFAAITLKLCAGVADFDGSQCDQKARAMLKGQSPAAVLSDPAVAAQVPAELKAKANS
ncbi:MAG: hypothetical protein IBJ00_08095 [Alphaproteobacteria bacterium]|nr:hypothetical protein [Alphaproteobacteria bacterium]